MGSRLTVEADGAKIWRNEEGQLDREDGPAVIWPHGTKLWYRHEQLHRELGPAVIFSNGTEEWYRHGARHRDDGPAVIWTDGTEEWWLNAKMYSFQEWVNELNLDQKTRLEMVMKWNLE